MAEALEDYIMRSQEEEIRTKPDIQHLKTQVQADPAVDNLYRCQCLHAKLKTDASITRVLEKKTVYDLTELDLSNVMLMPEMFESVCMVCRVCPKLATLNLDNTGIKSESIKELVSLLHEHPGLTSVSLAKNMNVGFSAAKLLLPVIKKNRRLVELNVDGTGMAAPSRELLRKILNSNKNAPTEEKLTLESPELALVEEDKRITDSLIVTDVTEAEAHGAEGAGGDAAQAGALVPLSDAPDPSALDLSETKQTNMRLKSELFDHEERLVTEAKELLHRAETRPKEIKERQSKGMDLMELYRDGWKWPIPADFNRAAMIAEFALQITETDLAELEKYYTPQAKPVVIQVKPILTELVDMTASRRRKAMLCEELSGKAGKHGPGMPGLIDIVRGFVELMSSDGTSLEHLKQMLNETSEQMSELKAKIDRLDANRAKALQDEDIVNAELMFEDALLQQEKLIDLIQLRLSQLLNKGSKLQLEKNLKKLCHDADEQMNKTKNDNDDLLKKLNSDIATIKTKVAEEQEGMRFREQEFDEMMKKTHDFLLANQRGQEKAWTEIMYSFKDMQALADARFKEIESWSKEIEKQERRKVEFNATIKICEEHVETLKHFINDAEAADHMLKHFDDFYRLAAKTATDVANSVSSEGDALALEEQKFYLVVFRRYYCQLGEMLYKKSKRLEDTERMMRGTEFQISFCKETLDPDLHRYRDQLRDLQERRTQLAATVAEMQNKGDERATEFMPTEECLREANIEFDSPLLEMHEQIADRRAKVLQKRKEFLETDKKELVEKEDAEIEKVVLSTKQARKAGLATLIIPLSPFKAEKKTSPKEINVKKGRAGRFD